MSETTDSAEASDSTIASTRTATTTFETFVYDGCSQLVTANNDVSSLSFSYDSLGNCTGSSQDGLAQSATHDTEGNLLSLTYPSGRVVTYSYDALDQIANIATTGGGVSHPHLAQFTYAGPGRLATISRDNSINTGGLGWFGQPGQSRRRLRLSAGQPRPPGHNRLAVTVRGHRQHLRPDAVENLPGRCRQRSQHDADF